MLQPTDGPPTSRAPRLAASITPGPPPVMTVKPSRAHGRADLAGLRVGWMRVGQPGRPEDGHARADEVQDAEAAQEFAGHPGNGAELAKAGSWPFEQDDVGVVGFGGVGRALVRKGHA